MRTINRRNKLQYIRWRRLSERFDTFANDHSPKGRKLVAEWARLTFHFRQR